MVFSGFSCGKIFVISFHRSSGMRIIVLTYFLLLVKYLTDNIAKQGAIFLSIFGIGSKSQKQGAKKIINKKETSEGFYAIIALLRN